MKITDLFIRRPVLAFVVNLVIIVAGIQAYRTLNVRQYPRSENASITVTTVYVGADADLVKGFITVPLERAIAAADGIDYLSSSSSLGVSTITARLKLNYDSTKALAEIGSKVDQVRGDLPPEAEVPIINIETADSQFASAYLSFTSDSLQANEITDYLVRVVQPRLAAVEGVQRADILGGRTFAMRIWLDPAKMAALNISPAQVRQALGANNYLSAVGSTRGALVQVPLTANTDLSTVEEFQQLVIRESGGAFVRLGDVADVVLGADNYDSEVRFSGEQAVFMGIWVLPNANSLDVIARIRTEVEALQNDLPTGMTGRVAYDATEYINDAISEVYQTLGETLVIVAIVIFLFLGSLRTVLIPIVAIPVSLIGAVFLMQVFGFTLNLLTLLAIVLSVGLVVDDAIVVVENVERHLREGQTPLQAAYLGARELVGPVIAMTITLAAVYTPIGLAGGLTGTLFREFAFTLAGAVMISGVVALTLSPVMSAKLLNAKVEHGWLPEHINAGFELFKRSYARVLDVTLKYRPAVYAVWLILFLLTIPMFMMSKQELAPVEDQGIVFGIVNGPANSTIDQVVPYTEEVQRMFQETPEYAYSFQITSPGGGFAGFVAKPWGERERTTSAVQQDLATRLAQVPGVDVFSIVPGALPGGSQFPVEFVIASTAGEKELIEFANQLKLAAMKSGQFYFADVDMKYDLPKAEIVLDREKVASLGLSLQQVGADLGAAVGGNYVNRFSIDGRSYKVIPQIQRADRLTPDQLADIYVTGPNGALVPLSTVATMRDEVQPRALKRFQQLNSVTISGMAGIPLDDALRLLEDEAAKILPQGYKIDYTGESRQLRLEGGNAQFLQMFALALILIFLVLAAQFNSFRDPWIILLGSVPLAMFGALIFTFLKFPVPGMSFWTDGWTTTLNIYAKIGLVTLVGLVAKNGILIVEFANELQRSGLPKLAALRQATLTRLRPVIMTSVATVCGHFPLTLVTGAGAAARNSIGIIVVAGMTLGTIFTLLVIPAIYMLIAKEHAGERENTAPGEATPSHGHKSGHAGATPAPLPAGVSASSPTPRPA
ncbi:MAG: efflux RND transporter permease subunit [Opitutaceae bacterium]|nr:efflux RND transporter permease subunit [Opitutaceae bacterium]